MRNPITIPVLHCIVLFVCLCQTQLAAQSPYVGSAEALSGIDTITPEQMEELRGKKILFASRSFGLNLRNGLESMRNQNSDFDILSSYIRYDVFRAGGDLSIIPADVFDDHNFVHFLATYWPHSTRIDEVDSLMRDAPWNFGTKVDVVMIFFHYAQPSLFDYYSQKMDALRADFPNVKFIYVTAGYMGPSMVTENNASYEFSELVRGQYRGSQPIYDMSAILSKDGESGKAFHPDYSTDVADVHPNTDAGQTAMAKGFLVMLRDLFFSSQGEAPTVPADLTATPVSEFAINLTWSTSTISEGAVSYYRVFRDDVLIATSTSTSYADTGLLENTTYVYQVNAVSNGGVHSALSDTASAQTEADTTPPTLVAALDSALATQVIVQFSEPLDPSSAENPANYRIDGVTVIAASLAGNVVTLTTSPMIEDTSYTVEVSNVQDNSSGGNVIEAGAQDVFHYTAPAMPSPIGHWSFDDDLQDVAGNDGAWVNGQDAFGDGLVGNALILNGSATGPYVLIPSRGNQSGLSEFTVSVWAKKTDASIGGPLMKKHVAIDLSIGQQTVSGYLFNSAGDRFSFGVTVPEINDTEWHNYSLVYNGATLKVFVDAVEVSSQVASGLSASVSQPIYVGKLPWGDALTFAGAIDELWFFDRAIDPDLLYQAALDHAAVQALLDANNVGRTVEGVSVRNNVGRIIELYLQEGGVTSIGPEIGQLTELLVLHCYGDRDLGFDLLAEVDPAIANCTKLQTVLLNENDLVSLPTEITQLNSLINLSVGENRLADVQEPVRSWLNGADPDWLPRQLNYTLTIEDYNALFFSPAELADSDVSGDLSDPDGDGISNVMEYFLQTDPTVGNGFAQQSSGLNAEGFFVRIQHIKDASALDVAWEESSNLSDWAPVTAVDVQSIEGAGVVHVTEYLFSWESANGAVFYRLSVSRRASN